MIRTPIPARSAARNRRRAAAALGGLLAAATLTACGGTAHPGTAAVVGDHRITTAAVEAKVAAFRDALDAQSQDSPQTEGAGLIRNTVRDMVLSDIVDRALQDHHLSVTDTEIAKARAADAQQLGGEAGLEQALLEQKGVAPADIDDFYRRNLGLQKLARLSGQNPDTEQGTAALRSTLAASLRTLKVEINPRYGAFDPKKITFLEDGEDWLRDRTGGQS